MHRKYHKFYAVHVYLRSIRISLHYCPLNEIIWNVFDTQERVSRIGAVMVQGGTSDTLMAFNETLVLARGAGR